MGAPAPDGRSDGDDATRSEGCGRPADGRPLAAIAESGAQAETARFPPVA